MAAAGADKNFAPHISLLIPGLFGPSSAAESAPVLPALETWLARSEPQSAPDRGSESMLFSLFGAETPADADLPVAAVTRALDLGVIDNGWWLRADPVHLRPERDRLILADSRALDLAPDEANRLVSEIMEHYKAGGWQLEAARPGRWYLKPPRAPRIRTTPLAEVVGRDIHPYLPRGADGRAWHVILNEIQILLHGSQVNAERERRGLLPVNSLWFWGGGRLPAPGPAAWRGLWSGEPLSLALARLAQVPARPCPDGFEAWQLQASTGDHLLVLDGLRRDESAAEREAALEVLERQWFAPLIRSVRSGALAGARLLTDDSRQFLLTRALARRWWRRRRPLSDYACP